MEAFTIDRAHIAATDWSTLKRELYEYTGSQHDASCILRGIERLGTAPTIAHYEITPRANPRVYPGAPPLVWTVTAVAT